LLLSRLLTEGDGGGWIWLVQWVAMGPIFVEAFARARTLERAMAGAVVAALILQVALISVRALEWGQSPWALLREGIEAAIRRSLQAYGGMGMGPEGVRRLQDAAPAMAHAMATLVPGLFVSMDLLLHWWTLLVNRRVSALWGGPAPGPDSLGAWGIPYPWVWLTILGGILALLPGDIAPAVGINMLLVMGTVHFLQGIAVVSTLFHQRRIRPFFRGAVYTLIFLQQVFLLGVMAIGLFDLWFDFRRRWGAAVEG